MKLARVLIALAGLALVLGAVNLSIAEKEETLANGRQILLELRPVDPRSLLQGDYMTLRYAEAALPDKETANKMPQRGIVILKLDEAGVATFVRAGDDAALAEGEIRLRYKLNADNRNFRYGAESFFFQEGDARLYENARYGVLRVDDAGASVLVGLADENKKLIVKPAG